MSKRQKLIEAVARLGRDGLENIAMTPDPLPPPAAETRRERQIAHCHDCGSEWVDNGLNRGCTCLLIKELRAALATERAARIAVEQDRDKLKDELRVHVDIDQEPVTEEELAEIDALRAKMKRTVEEYDIVKAVERAEQAEASLAAMTAERDRHAALSDQRHDQILTAHRQRDKVSAERDALRTAVEAFLAKHDAVQPAVVGAFQMAAIHGMPYTGPNYVEESIALRAILASRAAGPQGETDHGKTGT